MKKRLLNLPTEKLFEIAASFSIVGTDKKDVATRLTEYLKGYGLNYADLSARFDLPSQTDKV